MVMVNCAAGDSQRGRGDYKCQRCEPSHCPAPSVSVNASGAKRISPLAASNNLKAPPSKPVKRNAEGPMPNKPAGWQPQSDVVAAPEAISTAVTEPL